MSKTVMIPDAVAAVLKTATVEDTGIRLPEGQIDRALYVQVDKVLKTMGGKWNKSAGMHLFAGGMPPDLTAALDAGHVVDRKKTLELFETPPELASRMAAAAAQVSDFMEHYICVLEPSAGTGRLLAAFAEHLEENGDDIVVAIDVDEQNVEALRAQGIADFVTQGDFIEIATTVDMRFDVILMNPPFSRNQDITHVNAALTLLQPGGVLVALMSPHFQFANDGASRDFRDRLELFGAVVEEIEAGTFKAEGTNVRTVMVTFRMPQP